MTNSLSYALLLPVRCFYFILFLCCTYHAGSKPFLSSAQPDDEAEKSIGDEMLSPVHPSLTPSHDSALLRHLWEINLPPNRVILPPVRPDILERSPGAAQRDERVIEYVIRDAPALSNSLSLVEWEMES